MNESNQLVTVASFEQAHEAALARMVLEAEGIECSVQDEHTAQIQIGYSTAIGGIKLKVRQGDLLLANEFLSNAGYSVGDDDPPSQTWTRFDTFTSAMPLIGRWRIEARFLLALALVASTAAFALLIILSPSLKDELVERNWCVKAVKYDGISYSPNTLRSITFYSPLFCSERADFQHTGRVWLPGIDTRSVNGKWEWAGEKQLRIMSVDTLSSVYEGEYAVRWNGNGLILESDRTAIYMN
jgi:hypothetical protein